MYKEKIDIISNIASNNNDEEVSSILVSGLERFNDYVKACSIQTQQIVMARMFLEGEDLRDRIEELDRSRKRIHDICIDCLHIFNRIAASYNVEQVYDFSISSDRTVIADTVIKVIVDEYFQSRSS